MSPGRWGVLMTQSAVKKDIEEVKTDNEEGEMYA